MQGTTSLAPGEIKILRALGKYLLPEERKISLPPIQLLKLKSYSELKEETGLSDPVLSRYLKNLQKVEFIRRDIETRRYSLVEENGEAALKILYIVQSLNWLLINKNARPLFNHNSIIDPFYREVKALKKDLVLDSMFKSKQIGTDHAY